MIQNRTPSSPVRLTVVDLWDEITPPPARVFARVGADGQLFTQGSEHHGLVRGAGDFVYVRFGEDESRVDSAVRTSVKYQTIPLDDAGVALVIGGDGDRLYAVDRACRARCLGVCEDARFTHAAWLSFGFATLDRDGLVTLFRWRDGEPAQALASYEFDGGLASFDALAQDVLLVTTQRAVLTHARPDGSLRELARFERDLLTRFQCTEESGRHMTALREGHVTEGGDALRIDGLDAAVATREGLPLRAPSARGPITLSPGPDLEPPAASGAAPTQGRAEVGLDRLPRFTEALITQIQESPRRQPPEPSALALLAFSMPADLQGYIAARATRTAVNVSVYEAWLDAVPVERADARALRAGRGSVSIALGTIANGDPIFAVLRGSEAILVELSHEEDCARTWPSFESWLRDLCARAEDAGQRHGLEEQLAG
jgi:hypothetical protein